MVINLEEIFTNIKDAIIIDEDIIFNDNKYHLPEIKELKSVHLKARVELDESNEITLTGKLSGIMKILDSISLEEVEYPFDIEYDDFLGENNKKSENILDIFAFLWENILLEVPLQFTKVRDLSKFHGDGWRLLSEDDKNLESNPFSDLLKDFEKKEW